MGKLVYGFCIPYIAGTLNVFYIVSARPVMAGQKIYKTPTN